MIDSHIHLDLIQQENPDRIPWMVSMGCEVISWAFNDTVHTLNDLKNYLTRQHSFIEAVNAQGLKSRFLTGIHPRTIPPELKVVEIPALLEPFLAHPLCQGLGEIGLETGDERECDILRGQLSLHKKVQALGKKIGVHTPRERKADVTRKILKILGEFPGIQGITVVDHTTAETLPWVLNAGFHAGITISPPKTSLPELAAILEEYEGETDRIMVNTDSGRQFYEDCVNLCHNPAFDQDVLNRITDMTARTFFNLD